MLIRRSVTYKEKVRLLLKPYISRKDIQIILDSTFREADMLLNKALIYMKNNGYNILSMYKIPTKLFMELTSITIEEFIEKAEIERRLNNGHN